ncbi:hypothetical protein FOC1_g10007286, partial [Fusarium oxysporum f. sp. cubense race 1]
PLHTPGSKFKPVLFRIIQRFSLDPPSLPSLANAAANRAPSRGLESTGLVFTLRAFVVNFGDIFFSSWTILSVTSCVATQNTMSALVLD